MKTEKRKERKMKIYMAMTLMLVVLLVVGALCSKVLGQCMQDHMIYLESMM
jgi:hypothetical protein